MDKSAARSHATGSKNPSEFQTAVSFIGSHEKRVELKGSDPKPSNRPLENMASLMPPDPKGDSVLFPYSRTPSFATTFPPLTT